MRILILGGDGMLGHQLLKSFNERHDVAITLRRDLWDYSAPIFDKACRIYANIDVRSTDRLTEVFADLRPEVIINAVGIIKQRDEAKAPLPSLEINALLPHRLTVLCRMIGARLFQISTDCVFSGKKGDYTEDDFPDADDLYGRSKYLGEVHEAHCITLRTSIIGLELSRKKSLIEWFLAQTGTIKGFRKAIYTGLTTMEMARVIERVIVHYPQLSGVYHVASEPITKYHLLSRLAEKLNRTDINIGPDDDFVCDRSLNAERFRSETHYAAPNWDEMLDELAGLINLR
jgi:dTDP-4-dehydrorhamnose reductase